VVASHSSESRGMADREPGEKPGHLIRACRRGSVWTARRNRQHVTLDRVRKLDPLAAGQDHLAGALAMCLSAWRREARASASGDSPQQARQLSRACERPSRTRKASNPSSSRRAAGVTGRPPTASEGGPGASGARRARGHPIWGFLRTYGKFTEGQVEDSRPFTPGPHMHLRSGNAPGIPSSGGHGKLPHKAQTGADSQRFTQLSRRPHILLSSSPAAGQFLQEASKCRVPRSQSASA